MARGPRPQSPRGEGILRHGRGRYIGRHRRHFAGLDPIPALYWSAVMNGVVARPVLAGMMWIAAQPRIMGEFTIGNPLRISGWIATAVVAASVVAMGITAVPELVR